MPYRYETASKGKAAKKFISFPFGEYLAELKGTIKGGQINVAGPDVARAITDQIRPYRLDRDTGEKGNEALWMLNKLDNIDKHRELLLAVSKVHMNFERIRFKPGRNIVMTNNTFITPAGYVGDVVAFPDGIFDAKGTTSVQITIGEADFFYDQPLIPTLHQLAELTASAVDILEPFG